MSTKYEIKDTKVLQLQSLCAFAKRLGYVQNDRGQFKGIPIKQDMGKLTQAIKGMEFLDFNTVVDFHNMFTTVTEERNDYITQYQGAQCIAAKIVHKVHLHRNKKTGNISCYKHLVKFIHTVYASEFGLV